MRRGGHPSLRFRDLLNNVDLIAGNPHVRYSRRAPGDGEVSRASAPLAYAIGHGVGQFGIAAISVASLGALMGSKDKGGRHTKKVAAKNLKQKRAAKKAKKDAGKQSGIISP
jgi:hypothetical protein